MVVPMVEGCKVAVHRKLTSIDMLINRPNHDCYGRQEVKRIPWAFNLKFFGATSRKVLIGGFQNFTSERQSFDRTSMMRDPAMLIRCWRGRRSFYDSLLVGRWFVKRTGGSDEVLSCRSLHRLEFVDMKNYRWSGWTLIGSILILWTPQDSW